MAYNIKECNRDQIFLMPPSLREWLPEKDLAWFMIDVVEQFDLEQYYRKYREDGRGQSWYDPKMMVALLLYAYSNGIRSSREIALLCRKDIGFKVITANETPDFTTIARFRKEHGESLAKLFAEALKLCAKARLVKVGTVALDGTKIKANAALEANRSYKPIEEEVRKMLEEAEAKDAEEDRLYGKDKSGDELPEDMQDRRSRLARLKECKEQLEREASEEAAKQREKIERREKEEAEGRKKRGRKPKAPSEEAFSEAKANVTDPESRIMKTRKGYVQGYNGQAVVTEEQVIVAAELTTEENDTRQLHPRLEKAREELSVLEIKDKAIKKVLADAGYCSEENLGKETPEELIIATQKDWKERKEGVSTRGRRPKGMSLRDLMKRKLQTKRGKELYRKRGQIVEPIFGQLKSCLGFEKFMMRGLRACAHEWKFICAVHNLLKVWRSANLVAA